MESENPFAPTISDAKSNASTRQPRIWTPNLATTRIIYSLCCLSYFAAMSAVSFNYITQQPLIRNNVFFNCSGLLCVSTLAVYYLTPFVIPTAGIDGVERRLWPAPLLSFLLLIAMLFAPAIVNSVR